MKRIIVVSTGRCGTKRLSEILSTALQSTDILVYHQRSFSRICNVLGNVMYYLGSMNLLKKLLFRFQNPVLNQNCILTDPLSSMCIPTEVINNEDVMILHVIRDDQGFADSMFKLTRLKTSSFIAHNFVCCWQPKLWPLENMLSKKIIDKYKLVNTIKNKWFEDSYQMNPNYRKVNMTQLFEQGYVSAIIKTFFNVEVEISTNELKTKSNQSQP